jgi:hypothetical protein
VLAALLILVCGCKHDKNLQPPKEDAVYRLPPNDPRYSQLPQYPEKTLNDFPERDPNAGQNMGPGGASRVGMSGMGSPGMH